MPPVARPAAPLRPTQASRNNSKALKHANCKLKNAFNSNSFHDLLPEPSSKYIQYQHVPTTIAMQTPTHAGSVAHQERIVWQQIRVHDCLHWLAELQAFRLSRGCTASNLGTFWNFQVGCGFNFPTEFVSFAFESIIFSYFGYLMPKDLACISLSTQEDNVLLQALCRHPNFQCIILYHHSRSYLQYLHRSTLDCWQPTSTHTHMQTGFLI